MFVSYSHEKRHKTHTAHFTEVDEDIKEDKNLKAFLQFRTLLEKKAPVAKLWDELS